MVGTIEFRKGHDILLKAIATLDKDLLKKIHVVFVGDINYGKYHSNWIDNIIKETCLTNKVTFIKYCNPTEIYQTFDIFCLPSRLEGFPLVILEAMLSRNCVIRSNCEGAHDQITSGINGYIFENENIDNLADILTDLISNPKKIKEISEKGYNRAIKEFTSDIMAQNTIKVYNKIINEKAKTLINQMSSEEFLQDNNINSNIKQKLRVFSHINMINNDSADVYLKLEKLKILLIYY